MADVSDTRRCEACGFCENGVIEFVTNKPRKCPYCDGTGFVGGSGVQPLDERSGSE